MLPHQVTNVAPEAKDPQRNGVAYHELLFQHDFAAGEKSATFTVERSEAVVAPFPTRVSARIVPERLDDFAWENDKVAHRTYGPALAAPAPAGSDKEVLKTSGLDVWFKRVPCPIVDRWYNIGHDHYHHDEGEGIDSTFTFAGGQPLQVAVGMNKAPAGKGEDGKSTFTQDAAHKALVQWVAQKKNGDFGVAVILPSAKANAGSPASRPPVRVSLSAR